MKFSAVFEVGPPAVFGVPQDGMTVLPAGPGEYFGDSFDTWAGVKVGHGTLSAYRAPEDAIRITLEVLETTIDFRDNYATVSMEAADPGTAYQTATRAVDRCLQHLSLTQGRRFEWRAVSLSSDDQRVYPLPRFMQLASVTAFDLPTLTRDLTEAAGLTAVEDERLSRAMEYYEQALLLFDRRDRLAQVLSRQHAQLISSVFLNLWKALVTVVGDPSRDRDHQRRYKNLGLDQEFYSGRIKRFHKLRDEFDVAHPSLEEGRWQSLESEIGAATNTVLEVLRRYRQSLVAVDPSAT